MGEGEGQVSEKVGLREALEDFRINDVQSVLSTEEVVRWIHEATSKVDAASTTSGLTRGRVVKAQRRGRLLKTNTHKSRRYQHMKVQGHGNANRK